MYLLVLECCSNILELVRDIIKISPRTHRIAQRSERDDVRNDEEDQCHEYTNPQFVLRERIAQIRCDEQTIHRSVPVFDICVCI